MAYNLAFTYSSNAGSRLVSINTATGNIQQINVTGSVYPKTAVPHGGKLYFAMGNTINVYDPQTSQSGVIGTANDTAVYCGRAAPDGVLFWGTYPGGHVVSYDPATNTFTDHGRMDADGPVQYAYSIAADEGYVYVGLGQAPWYLAALNRSTGARVLYFKGSGDTAHVTAGVDGTLWYGAYKLINGEPVSGQTRPEMIQWYQMSGSNIDLTTWSADIGYEVNLDDAIPQTGKPARIKWRETDGEWQTSEITDLPISPQVIKRLYAYDETRLLCLSGGYGPAYLYTPATRTVELLGYPQISLYDACAIGGKWYLSGYPAATLEYDPAQPWTLTDSSPDRTVTNPRQVLAISKYHHFSAAGSDGRLYVAVTHERDSVGGELAWYDPVSETSGRLCEPLARWNPRGICAVGSRVVYSGMSLDGERGQLFVFNTIDPSQVERTITPMPDLDYTAAGYILRASDTDVIGIVGVVAYRQNVVTGAQVWRVTLSADAMGSFPGADHRVEIAPDGLIYFCAGGAIYSLNPADGKLHRPAVSARQGAIMWHAGTAYVYGTTTLRRYRPFA